MTAALYDKVRRDLEWYYNNSAASFGFKSSHSAFVSALYGTTVQIVNPDTYTDGILRQVKKYRKIRNILYSLPNNIRRILEAIYNHDYRYPQEIVYLYGQKAGAVLFSTHVKDLEELVRLCNRKIKVKLSDKEKVQLFNVGEDAKNAFTKAHEEYIKYIK